MCFKLEMVTFLFTAAEEVKRSILMFYTITDCIQINVFQMFIHVTNGMKQIHSNHYYRFRDLWSEAGGDSAV